MKSTIEELGPTRVRMAIEVPWGDLDHAFGEVYKELKRQVKIPGCPRAVAVLAPRFTITTGPAPSFRA